MYPEMYIHALSCELQSYLVMLVKLGLCRPSLLMGFVFCFFRSFLCVLSVHMTYVSLWQFICSLVWIKVHVLVPLLCIIRGNTQLLVFSILISNCEENLYWKVVPKALAYMWKSKFDVLIKCEASVLINFVHYWQQIRMLVKYLVDLKAASAEEMRKSVYANYAAFIRWAWFS